MGILDKVLSKVGTALATRYGCVASGKYAGCDIALGNPPTEKVSVANSFSQIIFIKDKEEKGRHNIKDIVHIEYLETIQFPATGNNGYRCKIAFPDGNTCEADLFPSKMRIFYLNSSGTMPKETQDFFEKELNKLQA